MILIQQEAQKVRQPINLIKNHTPQKVKKKKVNNLWQKLVVGEFKREKKSRLAMKTAPNRKKLGFF